MLTLFSVHEANGQPVVGRGAEIELRGTIGTLYAATNRYESCRSVVAPSKIRNRGARVKQSNHPTEISTSKRPATFLTVSKAAEGPAQTSRKDIARRHSRTWPILRRDPPAARLGCPAERFTSCEAADEFLHYEYRKPWCLA